MSGRVFKIWLYSYLAVMFIPISITMFVLWQSQTLLLKEVRRSNDTLLAQVRQSVDAQMVDIRRLGQLLSADPQLNSFLNRTSLETVDAKFEAMSIIKSFGSYVATNGAISDFYVYHKGNAHALTTGSYYSADDLFRTFHADSGLPMAEWEKLLNRTSAGEFINLNPDPDKAGNNFAYIQSLPILYNRNASATLVVLLSQDRIKNAISKVGLAGESAVYIVDKQGNPLLATGPISSLGDLSVQNYKDKAGGFSLKKVGDEKAAVSYLISDSTDWTYISVVPSRVYSEKVDLLKQLIYGALVLCITMGGGLAYWMTWRNYVPLRRMINMITAFGDPNPDASRDEFERLQAFLADNVKSLTEHREKMREQQHQLRSHFLVRLMKGRVMNDSALSQILEDYDIQFEHDRFAVALVHIEDDDSLRKVKLNISQEELGELTYFIVTNIMEEQLSKHGAAYFCEVEGMIGCLVNIPDEDEEAASGLLEVMDITHAFLSNRFGMPLSISLSNIHPSRASIPRCYEEAVEAMEYKLILGTNQVLSYKVVATPKDEICYPLNTERQIVNYVSSGRYEEAAEVVKQILNTNFAGRMPSLQMCKLLMYELVGTMLKAMGQTHLDTTELAVEKSEFVKRMTKQQTFSDMEQAIFDFLKQVCENVAGKKRSRNKDLNERIIGYIRENLNDCDLSLTSIAQEFEINPTYLSRFFKEQTGENLIDYINKNRVELAKELLQGTNEAIANISMLTGFASSQSLIRVFKKYEGITPGQYRQNKTD